MLRSSIPAPLITIMSTPSPLAASRRMAALIARVARSTAPPGSRSSLYPDSITLMAVSAPVPTEAYRSGITEPSGSKT
jgi:hypothetical protein